MASALSKYDQIFGVRRFPPGRLYTVLLAMRLLALEARLAELAGFVDGAVERVEAYVALRRKRQGRRQGRGGGKAKAVDKVVDDDIGEIAHIAGKEAARYPNTDAGRAAQALVDAFFAQGVAPVTQIPYDEELAVIEHMLPLMRAEHAEAIALLGIERLVARVERHIPQYRDALAPEVEVSAEMLGEAYQAMQVAFLKVLGWVMVHVDDDGLRDRLLEPMRAHDAQLAAIYAARRRNSGAQIPEDVQPDGLDLDAEALDAIAAADQAEAEAEAQAAAEAQAEVEGAGADGGLGPDPA